MNLSLCPVVFFVANYTNYHIAHAKSFGVPWVSSVVYTASKLKIFHPCSCHFVSKYDN